MICYQLKHMFSFGVIYDQTLRIQFLKTFQIKSFYFRLSQLAGVQMTENNPNVTDLSDINRPINLGEDFSEIYDNEYTDVLVHLKKNPDDVKNFQDKLLKTAKVR